MYVLGYKDSSLVVDRVDGKLYFTITNSKGRNITLTDRQWMTFLTIFNEIDNAFTSIVNWEHYTEFLRAIGDGWYVAILTGCHPVNSISIRRFYRRGQRMCSSRQGITLDEYEWDSIREKVLEKVMSDYPELKSVTSNHCNNIRFLTNDCYVECPNCCKYAGGQNVYVEMANIRHHRDITWSFL